jgi:hypothetical protein
MPYIKGEEIDPETLVADRPKFDLIIDEIVDAIVADAVDSGNEMNGFGTVNYVCLRIGLKVLRKLFGKLRYWQIPLIRGVYEDIATVVHDRIEVPYEKKKQKENGDVDILAEYEAEIGENP